MQLGLISMRKMQTYRKEFNGDPLRQLLKCTIFKTLRLSNIQTLEESLRNCFVLF